MADRKPTVLNPAGYQENLQDTDNLVVEAAPTADNHATNKLFVDTEVAAAGKWSETSGVLHPKVATNDIWIGTYQDPTVKFTAATGNADFDGSITAAGEITSNNLIRGVYFASSRGSATQGCYQSELNGTPTGYIYADGSASFSSGNITLAADGSITAAGPVDVGDIYSAGSTSNNGTRIWYDGTITTQRDDTNRTAYQVYAKDDLTFQILSDGNITAAGSATFAGGLTQIFSTGNQQWGGNGYDGTQGAYVSKGGTVYVTPATGTEAYLAFNEGSSTPTVTITGAGNATFAGRVQCGGEPYGGANVGSKLAIGSCQATAAATNNDVWLGFVKDTSTPTSSISAGGNATFAGNITAASFTGPVTGDITGDITGNINGNVNGNVTGDLTGNADTATKLKTARTIALSGDVSGSASFDGSSNITISSTVADSNKLDGLNSSQFLRSDTADSATGDITFTGGAGAATIGSGSDIQFTNGGWTNNNCKIQHSGDILYVVGGTNGIIFREGSTDRASFNQNGQFLPGQTNTYDLGNSATRWNKIFVTTYDLENLPSLP